MKWFYLSFADPNKPEGEQFLGACIVDAPHEFLAVPRAWELGINPGGEVQFIELEGFREDCDPGAGKYVRRFVPREEVLADGAILF